jgi:hypothetical protein
MAKANMTMGTIMTARITMVGHVHVSCVCVDVDIQL